MTQSKLLTCFFALILFFYQLDIFAGTRPAEFSASQLPNTFTPEQLQQAAEAGDPDAQYALGYMYYYGKNVPKDTSAAQNWIKRAAVQGQPQAISAMHMMGQNVAVNTNPLEAADTPVATASAPKAPVKTEKAALASTPKSASTPSGKNTPQAQPKAATHYYTIALLETGNLASMQAYIKKHHLQGKANYETSQRNGKNWYSLTYGKYSSLQAAKAGIRGLPVSVKAQKPQVVGKNDAA